MKQEIEMKECKECGAMTNKIHARGLCVPCYRKEYTATPEYKEKQKDWYKNWEENNKLRRREYQRQWAKKRDDADPEARRKYQREWNLTKKNKEEDGGNQTTEPHQEVEEQ